MLWYKIVRFKRIYKCSVDYFFMRVIPFLLFIKNVFLRIKNWISPPKYARCEKNVQNEIVHLKKIHRFTSDHFLIGHVVFVLTVKNFINIKKFHFVLNLCGIQKNVKKQNFLFQKDLQIICWLFFHRSYTFSFIHQKRFFKNQKLNFPAKICEMRTKCSEQNCSSQENTQIYSRSFFDRIGSFRFNCKKHFKIEKFYLAPNLCSIRKNFI